MYLEVFFSNCFWFLIHGTFHPPCGTMRRKKVGSDVLSFVVDHLDRLIVRVTQYVAGGFVREMNPGHRLEASIEVVLPQCATSYDDLHSLRVRIGVYILA
jgi:hypothetical protein